MTKPIGFQLVVYSLLLASLSYAVRRWAPSLSQPTFVTGVAGGTVCLLLGLRALFGHPGKGLAILALIPISFVMLSQTVMSWGDEANHPAQRLASWTITLLFVLSMGMLARIAYAGFDFDPPGARGTAKNPSK